MFGTVQERCYSRKGAKQLKIDGKYIYVGRVNCDGIDEGAYVEYDTERFGDKGTLTGLLSIRIAQKQQGYPPSQTVGGVPAVNSPQSSPFLDGDELRFISNLVGSAILAKTIASPTDVKGWTLAAKEALESLKGKPAKRQEHEFDDDLPPDESENPAPRDAPW